MGLAIKRPERSLDFHTGGGKDYYGQRFDAFFEYMLARARLELCLRRNRTPAGRLDGDAATKKLCSRLNRCREHSMKFR